jgi:hypothetical protein
MFKISLNANPRINYIFFRSYRLYQSERINQLKGLELKHQIEDNFPHQIFPFANNNPLFLWLFSNKFNQQISDKRYSKDYYQKIEDKSEYLRSN